MFKKLASEALGLSDILKNLNNVVLVGYTKRDFSDIFTKYIHA